LVTRLDCADSRAAIKSAALACAAAESLSMLRRMRPHTSISQVSEPPSANWPTELPIVEVEIVPPLRLPPELDCTIEPVVADGRIERRLVLADQRHRLAIGRLGRPQVSGWRRRPGR
jgi:hypothetical protein